MDRAAQEGGDQRVVAQVPDEHSAELLIGRVDRDVSRQQRGLVGIAAGGAGGVERVRLGAELADHEHLAGERPAHRRQARVHHRDLLCGAGLR